MLFELNVEKSPFLFVGEHHFSPNKEQIEIDVVDLDPGLRKQLLYNVQAGVLKATGDLPTLAGQTVSGEAQKLVEGPDKAKFQEEVVKVLKEDKKRFNKILKQGVSSVKKTAVEFGQRDLTKLAQVEGEGKNRKSVLAFIQERIEEIAKPVIAGTDVGETGFMAIPNVEVTEEETMIFTQGVLDNLEDK